MDDLTIILIVAAVVVIALVVFGLFMRRKQSSKDLRQHYGSEYDRVAERTGDSKQAEEELRTREERRERFELQPIDEAQQERYLSEWRSIQSRFVDEPETAVREADRLVTEVMRDRGYPMDDFEQRAEDISVDHPGVVENYRAAADIAALNARGEAQTEELRRAMNHFRSLFDDLLDVHPSDAREREGR